MAPEREVAALRPRAPVHLVRGVDPCRRGSFRGRPMKPALRSETQLGRSEPVSGAVRGREHRVERGGELTPPAGGDAAVAGVGGGERVGVGADAVPNATQPPLFLARFSPKFRPFPAIFRPFSPSRRQEAGQRKETAEKRRKTGEKRPRNSGLSGVGLPGFFVVQWSMSYQLSNAPARRNWL